jgi:hypothetical protein
MDEGRKSCYNPTRLFIKLDKKENVMSVKSRGIMVIMLFFLVACSTRGSQQANQSTEPVAADPAMVALTAAQAHLEEHLGRELEDIEVAYGSAEWVDTSLGCPQDGVQYDEMIISGFQFEMTVDGEMYELHTNTDGSIVVLCSARKEEPASGDVAAQIPVEIEKPLETAQTLLAVVLGVSLDSLELDERSWETVTFPNSGLGCPEPGAEYLETPTEGYSFSFTYQDRVYEIHTDLTGDSGIMCGETVPTGAGETPGAHVPGAIQKPSDKARALLAEVLGMPQDSLVLEGISWEDVTFPSSALGCPQPGTSYLDVETEGYIFMLTHAGVVYQVHTDLAGGFGVLCRGSGDRESEASKSPDAPVDMVFTSYSDETLGLGISYPLGWTVEPGQAEGEVYFGPAGNDPARGMIISDLGSVSGEVDTWLSDYQVALYSSDPTAVQSEERQVVGPNGQSQLYSREIDGVTIMERVTFFAEGYRVLQWGSMAEWATWNDPFLQMLNSLVFTKSVSE